MEDAHLGKQVDGDLKESHGGGVLHDRAAHRHNLQGGQRSFTASIPHPPSGAQDTFAQLQTLWTFCTVQPHCHNNTGYRRTIFCYTKIKKRMPVKSMVVKGKK